MLDALAGDWSIRDASGASVGRSTIVVQTPDAMLFEERRVGNEPAQQLWFERSERAGGWAQLFLGPNGIREFAPLSAPGAWPLVLGAHTVLRDGSPAEFRMTMSRLGADRYRRVLEISSDFGTSWTPVFDYTYVRAASR